MVRSIVERMMPPMQAHELQLKIYLEDTDAQGVVFHANYFKYCERARTEIICRASGRALREWQAQGYLFVVHELHAKYKSPARLDDVLAVRTQSERASSYRFTFKHAVRRLPDDILLVQIEAVVVAIGGDGALRELPEGLLIDAQAPA
jgi:acyl-CoA thioester hydrolase